MQYQGIFCVIEEERGEKKKETNYKDLWSKNLFKILRNSRYQTAISFS